MPDERGRFKKGEHWREPQPFWERSWLVREYGELGRSTGDIARQFGTTDAAIIYWLKKHGIPRRSVAQARALKHWGASGVDNPMWNRRGELNPNWRGGVTPERQGFYTSDEWRRACAAVWKRDEATCQRCGLRERDQPDMPFHIHHIVSFSDSALRADIANLVLMCEACHHWIHSRANVERRWLSDGAHSRRGLPGEVADTSG